MARGDAYNFPVVREAIGHADALYGFKGGFDRAGADPRRQGRRLLAAQPRNQEHHQPPVHGLSLRPRHRHARPPASAATMTAARTAAASAVSIKHLARPDAKVIGMIGAGHQSAFQFRAALPPARLERVIGWNLHPEMLSRLADTAAEPACPSSRSTSTASGRGRRHHHHHLLLRADPDGGPREARHASRLHGPDTKGKQEVEAALLARSDRLHRRGRPVGADRRGPARRRVRPDPGEARSPRSAPSSPAPTPAERSAEEITLFDGTGVGLQDLAGRRRRRPPRPGRRQGDRGRDLTVPKAACGYGSRPRRASSASTAAGRTSA